MQNSATSLQTYLPGPTADVPDRVTDSHREASPPRSTPYEADTVALQKQLEGTTVTKVGNPHSQITPSFTLGGGSRKKTFFKTNHYTPSVMLCISLQMHQKTGGALTQGNALQGEPGLFQKANYI